MQVKGDVGVAGVAQQQAVQGFQLRGRRWQFLEDLSHGLADQRDVGLGIRAQTLANQRCHRGAEFDERTVEILAAAQFEAAHVIALQMLIQANRIGHRHHFDNALQTALPFQFVQAQLEFPRGTHARQFIGVQAGLNVGLALALTETENRNLALAAQVAPRQYVINALHISASVARGSSTSDARPV